VKNKRKILIAVLAIAIIIVMASIIVLTIKANRKFIYTQLEDGTWEVSKYIGKSKEVIIPDKRFGRNVTRIGDWSFNFADVSYVYIPNTVTTIGAGAFSSCKNIIIDGAENVETIEKRAFYHSCFAKDFPFSDSLISIGDYAFYEAQGLENIELGERVEFIGMSAFYGVENANIIVPDTVKIIGVYAFGGTVISHDMDDYAIYGDNVLVHFPNEETVIVPEGVKVVSDTGSKRKCIIREMYIPNTVTYICGELIENCSGLKIYIPSSVEGIGTKENCKFVSDVFLKYIEGLTFVVESGSYAESYAIENNINYEIVDSVQALYEAAVASETEQ
jgi:hypothetical protein